MISFEGMGGVSPFCIIRIGRERHECQSGYQQGNPKFFLHKWGRPDCRWEIGLQPPFSKKEMIELGRSRK